MTPREAVIRLLTVCGVNAQIAHRVVREELAQLTAKELLTTSEALAVICRALGADDQSLMAEIDHVLRDLSGQLNSSRSEP